MAARLYKTESGKFFHAGEHAVILVGLPARGKTHTARSLCRYFRWLGFPTDTFHVGNYRRSIISQTPVSTVDSSRVSVPSDFFDPANAHTREIRRQAADMALEDMIAFLRHRGGQIGILDASNMTSERRRYVQEKLQQANIKALFVESICDNPDIIDANIRSVKLMSPDYAAWDADKALNDFKRRIAQQEPLYESIDDPTVAYIQRYNVNERMKLNNVEGYLPTRIAFFLMNLHVAPRTIYFARNGISVNEYSNKDDAELAPEGVQHSQQLAKFVLHLRQQRARENSAVGTLPSRQLNIWTSSRRRSTNTANFFPPEVRVQHRSNLVEINMGVCDRLTDEQVKDRYPEEWIRHQKEPYRHRYPRAESYLDLAVRLEPLILELESESDDVLIIGHLSSLRCLYAYMMDRTENEIPMLRVPRDELIEITPGAYRCTETRHKLW